jgi:DNA replication protein DnaC
MEPIKDILDRLDIQIQEPTPTIRLICDFCGREEIYDRISGDTVLDRHYPTCQRCRDNYLDLKISTYIADTIGMRYANADWPLFDGKFKRPINQVMEFMRERVQSNANLYIWGERGAGKTLFAAVLVRDYMRHLGIKERWFPHYIKGRKIAEIYKREEEDKNEVWQELIKSPFFVIDELVTTGDYSAERIFWLVDERYINRRMTIGISNHGRVQIDEGKSGLGIDFGPKIISRLIRDEDDSVLFIQK